jgi:hypothetical protein
VRCRQASGSGCSRCEPVSPCHHCAFPSLFPMPPPWFIRSVCSEMRGNVRERDVADFDLLVGPLRTVSIAAISIFRGRRALLNSLMLPISSVTSLGSTAYPDGLSTSISPSDMIAVLGGGEGRRMWLSLVDCGRWRSEVSTCAAQNCQLA